MFYFCSELFYGYNRTACCLCGQGYTVLWRVLLLAALLRDAGGLFILKFMEVIYAREELPDSLPNTLFLAGSKPRSELVAFWRPEELRLMDVALELLERLRADKPKPY